MDTGGSGRRNRTQVLGQNSWLHYCLFTRHLAGTVSVNPRLSPSMRQKGGRDTPPPQAQTRPPPPSPPPQQPCFPARTWPHSFGVRSPSPMVLLGKESWWLMSRLQGRERSRGVAWCGMAEGAVADGPSLAAAGRSTHSLAGPGLSPTSLNRWKQFLSTVPPRAVQCCPCVSLHLHD